MDINATNKENFVSPCCGAELFLGPTRFTCTNCVRRFPPTESIPRKEYHSLDKLREIFAGVADGVGNHGDFLRRFAEAFLRADSFNLPLLIYPARVYVRKYNLRTSTEHMVGELQTALAVADALDENNPRKDDDDESSDSR